MSDSSRPHGPQYARTLCLSLSHSVCSNSCPAKSAYSKFNHKETYVFKIRCDNERENKIRGQITKATKNENIKLTNIEVKTLENGNSKIYATITSNLDFNYLIDKLMNTIASEKGILSVGWNKLDKSDDDSEDINEI